MNALFTVILVIAAIYVFFFIRRCVKRITVTVKLMKLAVKNDEISLKFTRNPIAAFFKMSHAPDLTLEVGNKIFLVRFYNGRGPRSQVHFANAEYSAVFSILMVRSFGGMASAITNLGGRGVRRSQSTTSIMTKVRIVPKLDCEAHKRPGKMLIPVFIFNPAPSNVSYVSAEKTSIKLAFTGDIFNDTMIFTGSTFKSYIEREARHVGGYDERIIFHTELE